MCTTGVDCWTLDTELANVLILDLMKEMRNLSECCRVLFLYDYRVEKSSSTRLMMLHADWSNVMGKISV